MPHGPQKLILINSGRYDFAEVESSGSLQIVGPNNTGKTTLINTLQFLYLDDRRYMDFGAYTADQTRDYYFPNQYSYVLFQCLGGRGQFVFGWRGQSKAAGGEPERFYCEGPFDSGDFFDEKGAVREPKAVAARLASREFALVKTAHEHRELLLLATKGEARGVGLVALRDNDRYPQFRETLKDLLSLSKITQDKMRDRLLMLAGLSADKYALDVRELFGEDYDRIRERKRKLTRFKEHQSKVELFVDTCAERDRVRGELVHRWSDLRPKREAFEKEHDAKIEKLATEIVNAKQRMDLLDGQIADRRADEKSLAETKGKATARLDDICEREKEFADFAEDLSTASLTNLANEIHSLKIQLASAQTQARDKVKTQVELYRGIVKRKRDTIAHFDRALVTVLRRSMTDVELAPLARLFNFDLLETPVGDDGIRLKKADEFLAALRALRERISDEIYRDSSVEIPLPVSQHTLAALENPEAIREQLADNEETLRQCEATLRAIDEREEIARTLKTREHEHSELSRQILRWEVLQKARATLPQLRTELKQAEQDLKTMSETISKLIGELETARKAKETSENSKRNEENQFNEVIGRFNLCFTPDWSKPVPPVEAIPDDLDASVALFLRQQTQLEKLDAKASGALQAVPLLRYADLFTLRFTVTADDGKPHHYHNLDQVESHGTTITIKVLFNLLVLRSLLREDSSKSPLCEVPFFLDEIHSLDPANRRAIISTSRQLGFIAITAAPESVSEVSALYYLKPQKGRIVLRTRHRVGIKPPPKP